MRNLLLSCCAALCLALAGCGREASREPGLEWKGSPLEIFARAETPGLERLREEGFSFAGTFPVEPRRLLKTAPVEGLDTLLLLDFPDPVAAWLAFQEMARHPADFEEGFVELGERAYFRRGRWIGAMRIWSWAGMGWLENGLSLPEAPAGTAALPPQFASLIRRKRFEGSERILAREFVGRRITTPVYVARYDCWGDSAWIYASSGLGRDFGLSLARDAGWKVDSTGSDLEIFTVPSQGAPFRLRFSARGMAAVEGCFDSDLTEFWLKMQSRGLKGLN